MRVEWRGGSAAGLVALVVCLCLSEPLGAATIKKKSGQVVEGEINGYVVQVGRFQPYAYQEAVSSRNYLYRYAGLPDWAKVKIRYRLIGGALIDRIDEGGLETRGGPGSGWFREVDVFLRDRSDLDKAYELSVLEATVEAQMGTLPWEANIAMPFSTLNEGVRAAIAEIVWLPSASTDKILGQLHMDQGKARLLPAIEIRTSQGIVTVPVAEIVAFSEKAEETPEKKNN